MINFNFFEKDSFLNYYTYKYNMSKKINLEYNPTLESILTVENLINKKSGELTKYQLWKKLPKKMQYQKFSVIIEYLIYSGKVAIDSKGVVGWIYNPVLFNKYIERDDLKR
jgi:2',3'-cyclic-nucleotide 2'-phosphodiesterase (5'-nucleotidase family)